MLVVPAGSPGFLSNGGARNPNCHVCGDSGGTYVEFTFSWPVPVFVEDHPHLVTNFVYVPALSQPETEIPDPAHERSLVSREGWVLHPLCGERANIGDSLSGSRGRLE